MKEDKEGPIIPTMSESDLMSSRNLEQDKQTRGKSSSNLKSDFSSRKLLMHQDDRYQTKGLEKGLFARGSLADEDNNYHLEEKQKSKQNEENDYSQSIIRRGRSNVKLSPVKPMKLPSTTKIYESQQSKNQRHQDILMMHLQKLRLKTKYKAEEIQDINAFAKENIPKHKMFIGTLKRDRSGCKRLFPDFNLYFTEELQYALSSRRKPCFTTSTFHMSSDNDIIDDVTKNYVGTLRSNFSGTIYNINDTVEENQNLATIFYNQNCSLYTKPREIQIYVVSPYYQYSQLKGINGEKNLKDLYQIPQNYQNNRILKFINKKPVWNERTQSFRQDFHGKVKMASVKNMIIVDAETEEKQALLIGKTEENTYNIDIHHPFSLRIAMGIICSSFDFKWLSQ